MCQCARCVCLIKKLMITTKCPLLHGIIVCLCARCVYLIKKMMITKCPLLHRIIVCLCARCVYLIKKLVLTAKCLKHFSLGCMEVLQGFTPDLLPALTQRHASSLHTLHLASVKEDWFYNIVDISPRDLTPLRRLHTLSLDYDNLTAELLLSLAEPGCCRLRNLSLMVHGVRAGQEHVDNHTWWRARQTLRQLEVTLIVLHTYEGVTALTSILQPRMPLVRLRQYFCSHLSVAAITFIGNHLSEEFRELEIVEEMENRQPQPYNTNCSEDPFVMLAWRCHSLVSLRLIG